MATFAQKQNNQQTSSNLARPRSAKHVPGSAPPTLRLQRTIGNQAVGRLLSGNETANQAVGRLLAGKETATTGIRTGLPDNLKAGIENLSGMAMDDVRVHYNSSQPAGFQALAYTRGRNIYLGPSQENHLPHEAWHVAQQKLGRVQPTPVLAKGAPLNDDRGLESEADRMGALALSVPKTEALAKTRNNRELPDVLQRKKVPTDYGEFETTKFAEADSRGVEITLKFTPDETKVDAKKFALSQSVRNTLASGDAFAIDPTKSGRMVTAGKSGAGFAIDQVSNINNPLYTENANLGAAQGLKDTPQSANKTADATELGKNTNYDLGHCFKENPADAKKKTHPAGLWDKPLSGGHKGESKTFESTALAIEGTDKDKYYGSVKWGFKMEGTDAAPTVAKTDIELASKGTPTSNFIEPAKLWNAGKTQGTIKVTADPEATVLKGSGSGTEKLAKDTKLRQLDTVMWGNDSAIQAEVLKADGTGSGKIYYVKNSDLKDTGEGGSANKALPLPAAEPAKK